MTDEKRDEFDERAAELLPCEDDEPVTGCPQGHYASCPAFYRNAVAAALLTTRQKALIAAIRIVKAGEGSGCVTSSAIAQMIAALITDTPAPQSELIHDWAWALAQMKAGQRVKLPSWQRTYLHWVQSSLMSVTDSTHPVRWSNGEIPLLWYEWFQTTDWQLVPTDTPAPQSEGSR